MNKEKQTEKRMYCLVAYNLSDIQKGIQALHAVAEYGDRQHQFAMEHSKRLIRKDCINKDYLNYIDWVRNWKTVIILNGGTTGKNSSMLKYWEDLTKLGVTKTHFCEPDLNDAMTAICFIVDIVEDSHIVQYLRSMNLA